MPSKDTTKAPDVSHVLTEGAAVILVHPHVEEAPRLAGAHGFGDHVAGRAPVAGAALEPVLLGRVRPEPGVVVLAGALGEVELGHDVDPPRVGRPREGGQLSDGNGVSTAK